MNERDRVLVAPCKDCPDRKVRCHSVCEKYKQFSEERQKKNTEGFLARESRYNSEVVNRKRKGRWG